MILEFFSDFITKNKVHSSCEMNGFASPISFAGCKLCKPWRLNFVPSIFLKDVSFFYIPKFTWQDTVVYMQRLFIVNA